MRRVVAAVVAFLVGTGVASTLVSHIDDPALALGAYVLVGTVVFVIAFGWVLGDGVVEVPLGPGRPHPDC